MKTRTLLIALLLTAPIILLAQEGYVPLEPIPGINMGEVTEGNLSSYLNGIFTYLVGLAAVLAVLYIVWGGFKWMSTDSVSGKSEGKSIIQQAVLGLLLVLSTYLILYTIGGEQAIRLDFGSSTLRLEQNAPQNNTGEVSSNGGSSSTTLDCSAFPKPDDRKVVAFGNSTSPDQWSKDCCVATGGSIEYEVIGTVTHFECRFPGYKSCFLGIFCD